MTLKPRHGRPLAFSLVDPLVALAVIGMAAALVLLAMRQSRASAQASRCAANLHQVYTGWWAYMDDNADDQVRPRAKLNRGVDGYWLHMLLGAEGTMSSVTVGRKTNYLGSPEVLEDPAHSFPAKQRSWIFGSDVPSMIHEGTEARNSYAYLKLWAIGHSLGETVGRTTPAEYSTETPRFYRQHVVRSSDYPVFIDGFGPVIKDGLENVKLGDFDPASVTNIAGSGAANRSGRAWHAGHASIVFTDGHVGGIDHEYNNHRIYSGHAIWGEWEPLFSAWR